MIKNKLTFGLAALLLLSGCASNKPEAFTSLTKFQNQTLNWKSCYGEYQCSKLLVPIDYEELATGSFELSLLRFQALDQSRRLGSLVVNPGGPGSSGVNYAYNAEYIVSPRILERYDIVGFDPRGVGESAPIKCLSDSETDQSYAADPKPDDAAELALAISDMRDYFKKCAENTKYLGNYRTIDSARDMDILRSALGDQKLNFLGKSYGTYLGTLYADLFPNMVGRFVLDGAVDPNSSNKDAALGQAIGFDQALDAFLADCLKGSDCELTGDLESARNQVTELLRSISVNPLKSKSDRKVTEGLAVIGLASGLYDSESGWPVLRDAFKEASLGSGESFLTLADQYSGRQENGSYVSNENDAIQVIDCLDQGEVKAFSYFKTGAVEFANQAPIFGPYLAYAGLSCRYFPELKNLSKPEISKIESDPILVIGTTRDPATPYKWAISLKAIFQNSKLITFDGDGHTGHGRGSKCVDSAVDSYLLSGKSPALDLTCYP
jgi:pimeloyl-ACP methyl ester carboxylesterase